MISYELIPKLGIGPIRLGMTHAEVYEVMGGPPEMMNPPGATPGEEEHSHYPQSCILISYSKETSTVNFIQVSRSDEIRVFYKGVDLLNTEGNAVIEWLSKETPFNKNDPELGYTYIFPEPVLSFWRSACPEDIDPIEEWGEDFSPELYAAEVDKARYFETVGLGVEGYWDETFDQWIKAVYEKWKKEQYKKNKPDKYYSPRRLGEPEIR